MSPPNYLTTESKLPLGGNHGIDQPWSDETGQGG